MRWPAKTQAPEIADQRPLGKRFESVADPLRVEYFKVRNRLDEGADWLRYEWLKRSRLATQSFDAADQAFARAERLRDVRRRAAEVLGEQAFAQGRDRWPIVFIN